MWDEDMQFSIFHLSHSLLRHMSCLYIMLIDQSEIPYTRCSSSNGSGVLLHIIPQYSPQMSESYVHFPTHTHAQIRGEPKNIILSSHSSSYSAEWDFHKRQACYKEGRLAGKHIIVYSFPERCDINSENEECQGILYNEATKLLSRAATAEELHMKTEYWWVVTCWM